MWAFFISAPWGTGGTLRENKPQQLQAVEMHKNLSQFSMKTA
jgi:hypothetical protein